MSYVARLLKSGAVEVDGIDTEYSHVFSNAVAAMYFLNGKEVVVVVEPEE